jgi:hypothetical protein
MPISPSGHHLRPWSKTARGKERPSQMSVVETREPTSSKGRQPTRSAVPWHEMLLLMSLLLVVAGWIIFRLVVVLLTLD